MNIYDLNRKELKKYDKEFMKTTYGFYISIVAMFPMIIAIIAFIVAVIFFEFVDDLNTGMLIIMGSFIVYSLGVICYILRIKELKKYVESKKKK